MLGAGEVVLVFLAVEREILREGHGRGGAHLRRYVLRVVEHFDLHGLVVSLLFAVVRAVVVLVPVLVAAAAGKRGVVREGHDGPVLAEEPVADVYDAGCVDDFQDVGQAAGRNGLSRVDQLLLALEYARVHVGGNT